MNDSFFNHMKKKAVIYIPVMTFILVFLSLLCLPTYLTAGETLEFTSAHFDLEKLGDGVYAAIHKVGGGAVCNGGIIDLGGRTVIFDPFLSLDAARDLKDAAKKLCTGPIVYVVNSHSHRDHTNGNMIFKPDAAIIATGKTRLDLMAGAAEYLERIKETAPKQYESLKTDFENENDPEKKQDIALWLGYYEALVKDSLELRIVPPDITFTKKIVLSGTERTIELVAPGHGHSESDLVLFLPEEGILFAGDLVFYKMHPYTGEGDPYNWLKILKTMQSWNINTVVPGHGPVEDASCLKVMVEYLVMLDKTAQNLLDEGISPDFAEEMPVPKLYEDWDFGNFFAGSVKFMMTYVAKKRLEME